MKKFFILLAALMLCSCGDVSEFSHMEDRYKNTETLPALTFAPSAEAEEESAGITSSADKSESETIKADEITTKIPESTSPADADIKAAEQPAQTDKPVEEQRKPGQPAAAYNHVDKPELDKQEKTEQPNQNEHRQENNDDQRDPDFHSDIYQPAWFVSQCFSANWDNYDLLKDGYKAVIRNTDDLRAYMEPIYPEDFIQERINFYTKEIFYGEDFFDNNVLIVNTLSQGSGTEPMAQIDHIAPSDSMINIKYSWKYEDDCAYADVMSVCFLQVTANKAWLKDKGILWTMVDKSKSITPSRTDCYTLTDEDKSIFAQLNALTYTPITCDGLPEYTLQAPDGTFYQINLSGKWVWKNMKDEEAQLPDELVSWLRENGERIGMTVATWN